MREIKFRAWVGEMVDVRMIDWDGETFNKLPCIMDHRNDIWPMGPDYVCDVEQFTGLKDKNGREIYDGDILATSNDDPEFDLWDKVENGFTVVKWSDFWAGFRGDNWDWENEPSEESIYSLERFVEVIGNIHENKDLI